jgi:hypothetical protein
MIQKPLLVTLAAFIFAIFLHLLIYGLWLNHRYSSSPQPDYLLQVELKNKVFPSLIQKQQVVRAMHPQGAYLDAPPPPSPEDWAFAAKYSLKNSKAYRHTWGQQVRSMMGTAHEGVDQGQVRFSVEIAPNGTIVRVDTIWKTSDVAEALARKAIYGMPPLPPTPTGKPLIFERTIAFTPYETDGPPIYKDDCLPDAPESGNHFVWDGRSLLTVRKPTPSAITNPQALADCLKQLPQDSIEAEAAHNHRQLKVWRSQTIKN